MAGKKHVEEQLTNKTILKGIKPLLCVVQAQNDEAWIKYRTSNEQTQSCSLCTTIWTGSHIYVQLHIMINKMNVSSAGLIYDKSVSCYTLAELEACVQEMLAMVNEAVK